MTGGPRPEGQTTERKPRSIAWLIGVAITLIGVGGAIWFRSQFYVTEWDTLSALGDFVSGLVAPFVFLWIMVTAWMQREELELQRNELIDTRKEFKRSADENAEQTRIMRETLVATNMQSVFEVHRLRMYYLAQYILATTKTPLTGVRNGNRVELYLFLAPSETISLDLDVVSVDTVLARFAATIIENTKFLGDFEIDQGFDKRKQLDQIWSTIHRIKREVNVLAQSHHYATNELIVARLEGIRFDVLRLKLEEFIWKLSVRVPRFIDSKADRPEPGGTGPSSAGRAPKLS